MHAAHLYRKFRLAPRIATSTTTVTGNNGLHRHEVFRLVGFDAELREGEDVALNHAIKQHRSGHFMRAKWRR